MNVCAMKAGWVTLVLAVLVTFCGETNSKPQSFYAERYDKKTMSRAIPAKGGRGSLSQN